LPVQEKPDVDWGERLGKVLQGIGRVLVVIGRWIASTAQTTARRLLPGDQRTARQRRRKSRPIPKENPRIVMPIAAVLPILTAIVVWATYRSYGTSAVVGVLLSKARDEANSAQEVGLPQGETRKHWENVLFYADAIIKKQPGHTEALSLREKAQASIDQFDNITRLHPIEVYDFGSKSATTQLELVVQGQAAYVLDSESGWVAKVALASNGNSDEDDGSKSLVVSTGRNVISGDGGSVGDLTDCAWVAAERERRSAGLVVLEAQGFLVNYDPAWGAQQGTPHLTRFRLPTTGSSESRSFDAIESFEGRIYVLDTASNQIWRYKPSGDTYPDPPEAYLGTSQGITLTNAIDMAIDGNIYVLQQSGEILKFLGGQRQQFAVRDLAGGLSQSVALAIDQESGSGRVYVADRGNQRIVVLEPDGLFKRQFRDDEVFAGLQDLVVDEGSQRLYILSWGRLFIADWS